MKGARDNQLIVKVPVNGFLKPSRIDYSGKFLKSSKSLLLQTMNQRQRGWWEKVLFATGKFFRIYETRKLINKYQRIYRRA